MIHISVYREFQQNAATNSEHLANEQTNSKAISCLRVVSESTQCKSEWKGR